MYSCAHIPQGPGVFLWPFLYNAWVNSRSNRPPPEHTWAFDLIGYDSVNARVRGHNLKPNARPLGKLRVENAPPRGRFYSRFHKSLTTNVPNFFVKFASSLRSSEAHIGILKPICKQSPWLVREVKEANQMRSLQTGLWISLWTFELRNNLVNFATNFGKFVVKVSWNRLY
jgi:hypothetical protein